MKYLLLSISIGFFISSCGISKKRFLNLKVVHPHQEETLLAQLSDIKENEIVECDTIKFIDKRVEAVNVTHQTRNRVWYISCDDSVGIEKEVYKDEINDIIFDPDSKRVVEQNEEREVFKAKRKTRLMWVTVFAVVFTVLISVLWAATIQ